MLLGEEKWLREELESKTVSQIAIENNCGEMTVYRRMKKFGIKKENPIYMNKEWLENEIKNKTIVQISQEQSCDTHTISRWAKKFDIGTKNEEKYMNKDWLLKNLNIYGNIPEIAKATGYNRSTLNDWFLKYDLEKCVRRYRKYKIREDYFDNIDTEEKSYFLGLLMADGFMNKNIANWGIGLKKEDAYIIEKLADEINYKGKIAENYTGFLNQEEKTTPYMYLTVCSNKMCRDLIYLGITPKKTGREIMPSIKKDLKRHFIRGFMDGDGSVLDYRSPIFFLCSSSYNILDDINSYFSEVLNVSGSIKKRNDKQVRYYNYNIYGQKAKEVLNHIYKDSTIHLERKYKNYISIIKGSAPQKCGGNNCSNSVDTLTD